MKLENSNIIESLQKVEDFGDILIRSHKPKVSRPNPMPTKPMNEMIRKDIKRS